MTSHGTPKRPPWEGGEVDGWSVSSLFRARAQTAPDSLALVLVDSSAERSVTWRELESRVDLWRAWLTSHGAGRGNRVASLMSPSANAVALEVALYCVGAVSVSIYPTSSPKQITEVLEIGRVGLLIADSEEQLSRARQATAALTGIEVVEVPSTGKMASLNPARPDEENTPDTVACIVFTSGTTGQPKGVVHTHGTLLHAAITARPRPFTSRTEPERLVWQLPMAHVVGKIRSSILPLVMGLVNYIPIGGLEPSDLIQRIRPTYVVEPPRFWAKSAERAEGALVGYRAAIYRPLFRVAGRSVRKIWQGEKPTLFERFCHALGKRTVFASLLRAIGYDSIRYAYISSAAIPEPLVLKWHVWGINLHVTYGLTESGGRITEQTGYLPRPDSIGRVVDEPGWQVRLADDGELLVKGPSMFTEYWENLAATAESVQDGWFKTGDLAEYTDERQLRLSGRKKEILITQGGKSISPQSIESHFDSSPRIHRLIAVGDGQKYITALVELASGMEANTATLEAVREEIHQVNERLSRAEQLKYFRIIPKPLTEKEGHLTINGKLRRKRIDECFRDLIDDMYW